MTVEFRTIEASKSGQEMEIGQIRESLISDMNASKEEMTSDISSMKADFEFLSNRVDEVDDSCMVGTDSEDSTIVDDSCMVGTDALARRIQIVRTVP